MKDWEAVSKISLSEDFVERHINDLNWYYVSINSKFF